MSARGQIAVVTGGGRGLGRAFAIALAQSGMRVAIAARSKAQLDETVGLIRESGGEAISIPCDITDRAAVSEMFRTVQSQLGHVDLLVNSAGAGVPFGPTWETDPDDWWRNIEINVRGPLLCSHAIVPGMIERGRGRIVNVASGAGIMSFPYMSAYVTGKTALIRLTELLADELREHGVYVFAIQPGTVRTALAEELLQSEAGARWMPWFKKIFDDGRDVSPAAAAELVLYLASGQADGLSGRLFDAARNPKDAVQNADEIRANDLQVLRMRFPGN